MAVVRHTMVKKGFDGGMIYESVSQIKPASTIMRDSLKPRGT